MPTILLTDPIDPGETDRLFKAGAIRRLSGDTAAELEDAVRAADVVIVRRQLPSGILASCPRLLGLVRHGVGLDFIPVDEASALGIAVTNTPDVNALSVAEHAVGLMLAAWRGIARSDREVRAGNWSAMRALAPLNRELSGSQLGIVGFGAIGQEVARICHFGFGMTITVARRSRSQDLDWVAFRSLEEVIRTSDVLVVACPLTEETTGLIDGRLIAMMRDGVLIVNVARGAIIDEASLSEAVARKRIMAALDVFAKQPLPPNDPLTELEGIVLSPHVAGITRESMARMSRTAVDDTLRILRGERPRHLVNAHAWHQIRERWTKFRT
ncbi:NAD(P)-dependent oxidoreductase [Rhodospirillaceae bacterium SYSU D60014]|uniref:NAD(P)-dependent oxidoreductase n=1 Tax=Virgifigura deserti TaxID=2268457 RepID=UPI000E66D3B8